MAILIRRSSNILIVFGCVLWLTVVMMCAVKLASPKLNYDILIHTELHSHYRHLSHTLDRPDRSNRLISRWNTEYSDQKIVHTERRYSPNEANAILQCLDSDIVSSMPPNGILELECGADDYECICDDIYDKM